MTVTSYSLKLGDDDPPLEAILKDGAGQPADLTAFAAPAGGQDVAE